MTAIFAWTHQAVGDPFFTLIVTPAQPALTIPVSNGQTVAALQGEWSNSAPFTGTYIFVAPNFDHSGDYACRQLVPLAPPTATQRPRCQAVI
jgi:hypothetical protein